VDFGGDEEDALDGVGGEGFAGDEVDVHGEEEVRVGDSGEAGEVGAVYRSRSGLEMELCFSAHRCRMVVLVVIYSGQTRRLRGTCR
jgi:hypothetical protein